MTTFEQSSGSTVRGLRSMLRSAYRGLRRFYARSQLYWARLRFRDDAVRVGELQPGDVARVQAAFGVAGSQPKPVDLQAQAREEIGIVVAWLGRRPVGIGFVEWQGPRDAELRQSWQGVPEIHRLWVMPRCRTVGIGAALMRHIEDQARARGLTRIGLGVHDTNLRARALYLRLAYQPDPRGYCDRYLAAAPDGGPARQVSVPATFMVKTLVDRAI